MRLQFAKLFEPAMATENMLKGLTREQLPADPGCQVEEPAKRGIEQEGRSAPQKDGGDDPRNMHAWALSAYTPNAR